MIPSILVISGLPGSGKSEAAGFFKSKRFLVVEMGQVARVEARKRKLEFQEKNEKLIREDLRRNWGKDIFAVRILKKVRNIIKTGQPIIVEGLRCIEELNYLKQKFVSVKVIFIKAEKKKRVKRLTSRKERTLTYRQVHERDLYEIKDLKIRKVERIADFTLTNNKSLDNFYSDLEKIETYLK